MTLFFTKSRALNFQKIVIAIGIVIALSTISANASTTLFEFANPKLVNDSTQRLAQNKRYPITISPELKTVSVGDILSMPTLDGQVIALTVDQITTQANDDQMLVASNQNGAQLVLTTGNNAAFGSVYSDQYHYIIGHETGQGTLLFDQNTSSEPTIDLGDDGLVHPSMRNAPPSLINLNELSPTLQETSGLSEITLLVLYSPEFANGFGGSPVTRINQAIAFTNASLQRSGILFRFRLALAQQLSFPNNSNNGDLLNQVTDAVGAFSQVPQLRNSVGADMVTVMRFQSGNFSSGVAWINGTRADLAYSIVQFSQFGSDSVFAHELGHNMGSGHERASANPNAAAPCSNFNATGFSCGHGNASAAVPWGTIMSRLNSRAANNVFSNPLLTCRGEPCGIAQGSPNAADNTRSFNMTRLTVAGFRADPPSPPPPPPPPPPASNDASVVPAIIPLLLDE